MRIDLQAQMEQAAAQAMVRNLDRLIFDTDPADEQPQPQPAPKPAPEPGPEDSEQ